MAKSALFYEHTVPVSSEAHQDWSLDPSAGFAFAKDVAFVPVTTTEFEKAAWTYPLVFVHEGDSVTPCAIMGYRHAENLFVDEQGQWTADYVPACVRRYPFIFATAHGRDTLTLCLDDTYPGFNQDGRGEALFMLGGAKSAFLDGRLAFLQQFQAEQMRSVELAGELAALDLLEPVTAQVSLDSGQQLTLAGFSTVNRDRLRALPPEKLRELAQDDWLELIYIHLFSLANFAGLMDRFAQREQAETST